MNNRIQSRTSALRVTASTFGVLAGIGGFIHGVGEVLQGSVAPDGIIVNSWTHGPIASNMGGEPGMTVVPNMLITGILCIVVSLAVILWAAAFVQRKRGGWVLLGLSVAMMLVGGGFGPPIIGMLAGVAGTGIDGRLGWWRTRLPASIRRLFASLWPFVYGIAALNGVFLVIGSLMLVYFFDVNNPELFVGSFFFAVVSILLTDITAAATDAAASEVRRPRIA